MEVEPREPVVGHVPVGVMRVRAAASEGAGVGYGCYPVSRIGVREDVLRRCCRLAVSRQRGDVAVLAPGLKKQSSIP